jgi:hypothetical protein
MLLNTKQIFSQPRITKAILGVTEAEFQQLLPAFHQCLIQYRIELTPKRIRNVGGGRKGDLPTDEAKLLYILLYLKLYPTYDALAVLTGHYRSKCGDSVKLLLPVLEKTLGRHVVLPARHGNSLEDIFRANPELKDVFIDGTERRVNKPKNYGSRDKLYSGKKKSHTRKSIVLCDERKFIHFLSQAKSGRRHDKRLADKNQLARYIPGQITIWTDTGFQGLSKLHSNTMMPKKATKKHPLTPEQKASNRIIASIRVLNEHAIGGMKRFRAAADTYRNHLPNMDDQLMRLSAGLWNFHLKQTS